MISGVAIEMGLDSKKSKLMIFYVTVAHLLCTGTSLMNNEVFWIKILRKILNLKKGYIWPAMTTAWISVAASGIVALRESGLKVHFSSLLEIICGFLNFFELICDFFK